MLVQGSGMPALGFGTWRLAGDTCVDMVRQALEVGYRHVDTAAMYDNEADVGRALAESPLDRADVFVTTKVWSSELAPADLIVSAEASVRRLGVEYVDLLLIHWPSSEHPLEASLDAMVALEARGLTKAIGVSNFPSALFERAAQHAPIVCNQVEYHPFLAQADVLAAARRHGAAVTAYCPLAKGAVTSEPVIVQIASRHGASPAQVALRWLIQQPGVAAVPKTATPARLQENIGALELELSADEVAAIHALARGGRLVDPAFGPRWDVN